MTHKAELLAWFKRGLSITPAEAVDRLNNYRLADTVYQLRMDGHQIHTDIMERTNDEGRRVTYTRYSYISGPCGDATSGNILSVSAHSGRARTCKQSLASSSAQAL